MKKDGRTDYKIYIENKKVNAEGVQPNWYLHIENATLELGPIQPNWRSSLWELEGYKSHSR